MSLKSNNANSLSLPVVFFFLTKEWPSYDVFLASEDSARALLGKGFSLLKQGTRKGCASTWSLGIVARCCDVWICGSHLVIMRRQAQE